MWANKLIQYRVVGHALACVGSPKVVVVRGLQPITVNTDISDERLPDRFGVRIVTTATVGVVYNDHAANNVVGYLREVSHLHHHPNYYEAGSA